MSPLEWVLLAIAFVFWTILVGAFGFGVGYTYLKDRQKEQEDPKVTIHNGFDLSPEQIEVVKAYVSDRVDAAMVRVDGAIQNIKGPPGPPGDHGKTPDAKDIIMYNGDSLDDWAQAAYDRIKRVERKAGMSV